MDVPDWDVVVIGAGPGGGSAALQCARLGLRTLMIEDHGEIGTPVHCGECISALAVENLELDLPEDEDYDTIAGFMLAMIGSVPKVGESFEAQGFMFEVLQAEPTHIERVAIRRKS